MDIKRKTVIFEPRKEHLFLDISSTNIDTLIPSLYQCIKTHKKKKTPLDCSLTHFRTSVSTSSSSAKRLPPVCEPLYTTNSSHRKQETFLYEYSLHWVILPKKGHNRTLLFGSILLKH
jgi:hypothetical protein